MVVYKSAHVYVTYFLRDAQWTHEVGDQGTYCGKYKHTFDAFEFTAYQHWLLSADK